MCVVGSRLVVFGGHDGERMLNDLYELDTKTLVWTRIAVSGGLGAPRPAPRAGHTASLVGSTIVVFGGGDGERLLNDCWLLEIDEEDESGDDAEQDDAHDQGAKSGEMNGSGASTSSSSAKGESRYVCT